MLVFMMYFKTSKYSYYSFVHNIDYYPQQSLSVLCKLLPILIEKNLEIKQGCFYCDDLGIIEYWIIGI